MPLTGSDLLRMSVLELEKSLWQQRENTYSELEDWYIGGSRVAKYLIKFQAEEPDEFADRVGRLEYPNYVARLADALIDGAYGDALVRSLGETSSEEQQTLLDDVFEWNQMLRTQREIAWSMIVLGDGWANVAARKDEWGKPTIAVFPVHPGNIHEVVDEDNPRKRVLVTERRLIPGQTPSADANKKYTYWQWTDEEFSHLDSSMNVIESGQNVYGCIPYVKWPGRPVIGEVDGLSYVRDALSIQRVIMNKLSELDLLSRDQVHGLLVMIGYDDVKAEVGPRRALKVNQGGDAKYIQPGADITALREVIIDAIGRMFETGSVPMSLVRGGTANSGLQLAIEMRPFTRIVETIRSSSVISEKEMIRTICAVGSKHGMKLPDPAKITPSIDWSDNVLPSDQEAEFQRDLVMINNEPPLMTRVDFLRRWIDRIDTEEAAKKYEQELDAEPKAPPPQVVVAASPASPGSPTPPAQPVPEVKA